MQADGVETNTVVYNSALDACGRSGKPKVAAKLLRKMIESGESAEKKDESSFTHRAIAPADTLQSHQCSSHTP